MNQSFPTGQPLGVLPLSETSELRFEVSEYRGQYLANIRRFEKSERYTGYTKKGIALKLDQLEQLLAGLGRFANDLEGFHAEEICRIQKNVTTSIIARVVKSTSDDQTPLLDVREYVEAESFQGWTQKGFRIPFAQLQEALHLMAACLRSLRQATVQPPPLFRQLEPASEEQSRSEVAPSKPSVGGVIIEEVISEPIPPFPEGFLQESAKDGQFVEVTLPKEPLKLGSYKDRVQMVVTEAGYCYKARNPVEGRYLIYAQLRGATAVRIPQKPIDVFKAVTNYEKFVRTVQKRLFAAYEARTHHADTAEHLTRSALQSLGLPYLSTP